MTFFTKLPAVLVLMLLAGLSGATPLAAEPKIITVTSPRGITAWLVRETSIPMISMTFAMAGGASFDPPGKEGLSNFAIGLLDEGAGEFDSLAFQARLDDLAIGIGFSSSADEIGGSLKTLVANKDVAFEMLRLALRRPRFDAEPIARIRRQILTGLKAAAERPGTLMAKTYRRLAFPNHPYGRPRSGTVASITAITRDDLQAYARTRLARDRLFIGVVGDIEPAELGVRLDKLFADLPASAGLPEVKKVALANQGRLEVVQKKIPQAMIRFVMPGLDRQDPDFYAASLMMRVLGGGGMSSRFYNEVREKRGLAYGVWGYLSPRDYADLIGGGSGTANARAKETLEVMRREMARMRDEGISAEELRDAKTYTNGSFPLRFTSSGRIANFLVAVQQLDLGIDYIKKRPDYYNAVTLADIKRVAKRLIRPEKMLTIIVGEPVGLRSSH